MALHDLWQANVIEDWVTNYWHFGTTNNDDRKNKWQRVRRALRVPYFLKDDADQINSAALGGYLLIGYQGAGGGY